MPETAVTAVAGSTVSVRQDIGRMLRIAASCVVFSSFFALFATPSYDVSILAIPVFVIAVMPLAERLDRRGRSYRALTSALTFAFVVCLPILMTVINLLDAVTALVIYIQVYSMLHVKGERNYHHVLLMSFFLVLASAVLSPSPTIGVALFMFVSSTTWLLILLEMNAGARNCVDSGSTELVGLRVMQPGVGQPASRILDARMTGWILVSSAGVLALTMLLFFSSPRLEAGLFGATDSDMVMTALSHDIDLNTGGSIYEDTSAVMHVRFPEEEDGQFAGEMYWRNSALDYYTGTGWSRRGLLTQPGPRFGGAEYQRYSSRLAWDGTDGDAYRGPFGFGREVVQEIFLAEKPTEGVPALQLVRAISGLDDEDNITFRWDSAHDFTINSSVRAQKPLQYRVYSEVYEPSAAQLRAATSDYEQLLDPRDYELLTGHNLLPKTTDLVREITADKSTVYDKVTALQLHLSGNGFQYSLTVPDLPGEHPIDTFIHDIKSGHCQLYATALALMARSEGIPARVVSGYRGGSWSSSDQAYTITANFAHLWVEVYFPEYGWIPFDPSPPSSEFEGLTITAIQRAISRTALRGRMIWYQNVVGFTPQDRMTLFKDFAGGIVGIRTPTAGQEIVEDVSVTGKAVRYFPAFALLATVFFCAYAIRRRVRRPRVSQLRFELSDDQQRSVRLRRDLCDRLTLNGIDCEGKSVAELREAIAEEEWKHAEDALAVLESYNAVRFGTRPLPRSLFTRVRRYIASFRPAST